MRRLGWAVGRNPERYVVFDMEEYPYQGLITFYNVADAKLFCAEYHKEQIRIWN